MVRVHPGSLRYECPGTPTGRAARLKPMSDLRLLIADSSLDCAVTQSQIVNQQSQITWLGRQLADHLGLEPGMLWVRIPPELFINTSSRSSPECSPPCQGGDQGFKSPRGRFSHNTTTRYAIWKSGEAQTFVILWVRLPSASMNSFASAEHWRAQVAVTHPPSGFGGSTPSRRTDN